MARGASGAQRGGRWRRAADSGARGAAHSVISLGSIFTSTSETSGMMATVAVEVWIRPCVSVAGTRCTRWTPASYFIFE